MAGEIVTFNVGGTNYQVARSTLQKYPDSMLATLVSERWAGSGKEGQPIFIDRDPVRFRYILDLYRDAQAVVPLTVSLQEMRKEAQYFGLPEEAVCVAYEDAEMTRRVAATITAAYEDLGKRERELLSQAAACHLLSQGLRQLSDAKVTKNPSTVQLQKDTWCHDAWQSWKVDFDQEAFEKEASELAEKVGLAVSKASIGCPFQTVPSLTLSVAEMCQAARG